MRRRHPNPSGGSVRSVYMFACIFSALCTWGFICATPVTESRSAATVVVSGPIPKVIHQVWIGPENRAIRGWMDTFRGIPGWKHVLWTPEKFRQRYGDMVLQQQYDAEDVVQSKADILRYEVLWREGGVYVDADSVFLGDVGALNAVTQAPSSGMFVASHDFRLRSRDERNMRLYMNGVFGVTPRNPILLRVLNTLNDKYFELKRRSGDAFYRVTGPFLFSHVVRSYRVSVYGRDVFAPGGWFYPASAVDPCGDLSHRMVMMRLKFPNAVMFQVGWSTHKRIFERC